MGKQCCEYLCGHARSGLGLRDVENSYPEPRAGSRVGAEVGFVRQDGRRPFEHEVRVHALLQSISSHEYCLRLRGQ